MWYAKNVFSGSREILQYERDFPPSTRISESLLLSGAGSHEAISMLEYISKNWNRFVAEDDKRALSNAMRKLGALSGIHIYFRNVQCYYRLDVYSK